MRAGAHADKRLPGHSGPHKRNESNWTNRKKRLYMQHENGLESVDSGLSSDAADVVR